MKTAARWLLAVFLGFAGLLHFVRPEPFVRIVPRYLPAPLALVYISGLCEIAGSIGLMIPRVRRAAAWGIIALFVAVFPANVNMAVNHIGLPGVPQSDLLLWLRLPLQAVLILWAWWFTRPDSVRTRI